MKFEEEEPVHENGERWVLTYSDLITLLMVFFVVMYSMSSINLQKYTQIAEQLNSALGGAKKSVLIEGEGNKIDLLSDNKNAANSIKKDMTQPLTQPPVSQGKSQDAQTQQEQQNLQKVEKSIKELLAKENLTGEVTVYNDVRGTVISLKEALLFEKASAIILQNSILILSKISSIVSQIDNSVQIEGYTDDLPIHTEKFNSNWELGSQRAINVANVLIGRGVVPSRISCLSYGEFRPSVPNDSEENRSKNRKVDIVIIYKHQDKVQP